MNKKEELKKLYQQSKLSNRLLLVLIVAYILCLFLWNNWIAVFILCIPMIGLAIWDHRLLKRMKQLQQEIQAENPTGNTVRTGNPSRDILQPAAAETTMPAAVDMKSLNDLPKEFTVLDDVVIGDVPIDHVVVSPSGIWVVDSRDETGLLREDLPNLPEDVPVIWVDASLPLEEQAEEILKGREKVMDEQTIYSILAKLSGLQG